MAQGVLCGPRGPCPLAAVTATSSPVFWSPTLVLRPQRTHDGHWHSLPALVPASERPESWEGHPSRSAQRTETLHPHEQGTEEGESKFSEEEGLAV